MNERIWRRVIRLGRHVVERRATVREAARDFGVSKSTVHKDLTERLPRVEPGLAREVRQVLTDNRCERHLRGGEATRKKHRRQAAAPPTQQDSSV
ncbi:MAG TPA: sporulation transcriptional regulator SpoIIID [Bacillota bacterium]|nr:sporulation transcriptional regulator SpoIIID [Bacillota bacterium]